ncbi:HdeA/HdeB family chaperone [Jannaschia sp. LMIT008]|uniref:HdeA/HdeB family chaperone n=1 Tax=Jannaschia maritima TaxID=3032585 RepID=UPI002811C8A6|nr:peptidoglycan-binding protein [Jannaschia sp. LMIT008]
MRYLFLPLLLALGASPATAQTGAIEVPGNASCKRVVSSQTDDPDAYRAIGFWLGGFLSAANAYETEVFDLTPWQPLEVSTAQIVSYCQANPQARLVDAAAAYIAFLRPDALTEESGLARIGTGDDQLVLYEAVVDRIRDALIARDLLPADATGFDADAVQALTTFQGRNGLPETGRPDSQTLLRLFRADDG